jgi:hypothetical protein
VAGCSTRERKIEHHYQKRKLAKTAIKGMVRMENARLIRFSAAYQPVGGQTYNTAHVEGLRYPSGICMVSVIVEIQ